MNVLKMMGKTLLSLTLLMSQVTYAQVNPITEAVKSFTSAAPQTPASQILSPQLAEAVRNEGLSQLSSDQMAAIEATAQKIRAQGLDPLTMTKADYLNLYPEIREQNWAVIGVMFAVYIGYIAFVIGDKRSSDEKKRNDARQSQIDSYHWRIQRDLDAQRIRREKAEADKAQYEAERARGQQ